MLRSLLLALVMVTALLVLLTGASGGLQSLARPFDMLAAMVANVTADWPGSTRAGSQWDATAQSSTTTVSQPPGGLERQVNDLQTQLAQRSQDLASLHASQEKMRRDLGTLLQQRQSATLVPPPLQGQAAQPTMIALPPQDLASRRSSPDQRQGSNTVQQQDSAEAALARLRAHEGSASTAPATAARLSGRSVLARQQSQSQPSQALFPSPRVEPTQPAQIPSPSANLMTARQLLVSGRTEEARNLLVRAQTQIVLQPVAPDRPAAEGGSVAATRIGGAIRLLDEGNTGGAVQAINIAMASPDVAQSDSRQGWQPAPSAPPGYVYSPYDQR
jgi:hypothetical protein